MIILGIETSCDDTAVSVLKIKNNHAYILSNIVSSQIDIHADWGGVVPNIAAREHLKNIIPIFERSLRESGLSPHDIDLIAATKGPGLIPALLIGNNAAKTLAWTWNKPLLGIHHIEGHIYSNFISQNTNKLKRGFSVYKSGRDGSEKNKYSQFSVGDSDIKFPILCLVVSGGHTQLILMKNHLNYKVIGETLDDAAGEAFDKVARILGLGYPGGPIISTMAEKRKSFRNLGKKKNLLFKVNFPRPMIKSGDFNFSFSGLKTAVLYEVMKKKRFMANREFIISICREFQQAVLDVLISKTIAAGKKFKPKTIMIAGGVSANKELRKMLRKAISIHLSDVVYLEPPLMYSVDNAVMIAIAAYFRWNTDKKIRAAAQNNWKNFKSSANLIIR